MARGAARPTVAGRALVVPGTAANAGGGHWDEGNFSNLRADSRVSSHVKLRGVSAEDGRPVDTSVQHVACRLRNWLRVVLHDAGTNDGAAAQLPAELHVPVAFDAESRKIVTLDDAAAGRELAALRSAGVREWKLTEAPLADVRQAVRLPGAVRREVPGLLREWRRAATDLATDLKPGAPMRDEPSSPKEREQLRRTAAQLRHRFDAKPKERERLRAEVLRHYPAMAEGVAAGRYPRHGFEDNLMLQEVSGILSAEEAAALRRTAGL